MNIPDIQLFLAAGDVWVLAAGDVWEIVIGALFFIIWTVGQLLGNRKNVKKQKKPLRPRPPRAHDMARDGARDMARDMAPAGRQAGREAGQLGRAEAQLPPQVPARPRNQAEALRSEVEDFFRRAQGQGQPASVPERQQPVRQQQQEKPRTLVSQAEREQPAPPQPMPVEGQNLRQEGVAEHVAKHLNTEDIAEHSSALGKTVGLTDERLESRLHQKFDHDLGRLKHEETPAAPQSQARALAGADIAAEIATMLSDPEGMRKLIVANEILRRPEW